MLRLSLMSIDGVKVESEGEGLDETAVNLVSYGELVDKGGFGGIGEVLEDLKVDEDGVEAVWQVAYVDFVESEM